MFNSVVPQLVVSVAAANDRAPQRRVRKHAAGLKSKLAEYNVVSSLA
jgi:hypothetical protein